MELRKSIVILLALLLAAMVFAPIASAGNPEEDSVMMISGGKPVINSTSYGFDYLKYSKNITREEFMSNNKNYIDFLAGQVGYDTALKIENDEYTRLIIADAARKSELKSFSAAVSPTIQQVWSADIYLWPYQSQIKSPTDPNAVPITFVMVGKTKNQLQAFMLSHSWSAAVGESEYGLRGSSSSSLTWDYLSNIDQLQRGNPLTYRHHLLIQNGGYSSVIGKDWSYGECHYEYYDSPGHHSILTGGFDSGETQVLTTLTGGGVTAYSNSLNNVMSPWWSGSGHVFYI
jgi:hypothetical protein